MLLCAVMQREDLVTTEGENTTHNKQVSFAWFAMVNLHRTRL